MDNLKIRVANENESKEVQELFFELGLGWIGSEFKYKERKVGLIFTANIHNKDIITFSSDGDFSLPNHKEITLPELHDMVVLKRNDVADATHINFRTNTPFLVQGSKEYFYLNNKWVLSDSANDLKPIEKKEMKEYLLKTDDGYKLITAENAEGEGVIEVPEGAIMLIKHPNGREVWSYSNSKVNPLNETLWQRETLNDKVASAKEYRESIVSEKLMQGIKEFNQTEHGKDFGDFKLIDSEQLPFNTDMEDFVFNPVELPRTANEIADAALVHIKERASTYDQSGGERSAAKTALAFNAITGKDLTESEVWLLLQLLKDVRQWSRENYHQDSAEDCIAYAALKAESLERNR